MRQAKDRARDTVLKRPYVIFLYLQLPYLLPLAVYTGVFQVVNRHAHKVDPRFFELSGTVIPVLLLTLVLQSRFYTTRWALEAGERIVQRVATRARWLSAYYRWAGRLQLLWGALIVLTMMVVGEVSALIAVAEQSTTANEAASVSGSMAAGFVGIVLSSAIGIQRGSASP